MLIVLFRQTNAQYEEVDILERLDVRLLEIQPGDSGWDVFSLDYKVTPLLVIEFESSGPYCNCILVYFINMSKAKNH